jgi:penicillin amidase
MPTETLRNLRDRAQGARVALGLVRRALLAGRGPTRTLAERLAALPRHLPVARPVTIHWDAHQIPYIEAESDADLPVALGLVHGHLRLTQMEFLRRLSQGRVAEVIGPFGIELDRALRLFDFARAVPAITAGLGTEVRDWAEGFLRGVNWVIAHAPAPPEFALLRLAPEPWTLADLLTTSRLAGADVNWIVWARLLRSRAGLSEDIWRTVWPRLLGTASPPTPADAPEAAVTAFARTGSNAAAVAGWRSRSGAALLAADPHLSVGLPNIWLAVSMRSPGYNVAGLMPAGFPIVAIGRNPHLAWAGTSLHAASSDLFDASSLPLRERREVVRVRGGADRVLRLRESALGPIVSDGMILRHDKPLALSWIGHQPSDEMGAMLAVMRAESPEQFRAALARFALPGQNMLHAGRDGRIGHLLAARLPRRPLAPPADLVSPPAAAAAWEQPIGTTDLPHWTDPPAGFIASANDRPPDGAEGPAVPVGFFFSPADRVRRMRALLGGSEPLGLPEMAALQQDVQAPGALALRDLLLARCGHRGAGHPAVRAMADWRGDYATDSAGALAFEVVLAELGARLGKQGRLPVAAASVWTARGLLAEEIAALPDIALRPPLQAALRVAGRALKRYRGWGGMHRMRLRHHLGSAPLLGGRFTYAEWASPGGNDTLNKTGHPPARGSHAVSYGASARFLADLAEPDANRVVLLGGQDGWPGSTTFLDQATLWREGASIALPLQPEAARDWPHHTVLTPAGRDPM